MRLSRYSASSANHRDFQSVVIPRRNPYGLTFCPITSNPSRRRPRRSRRRTPPRQAPRHPMPRGRPRPPPWSRPRSRRRRSRCRQFRPRRHFVDELVVVVVVFVIVIVLRLPGGFTLGLALAGLHPATTAGALRLRVGGLARAPLLECFVLVARDDHRDVAGALADARAATASTRTPALHRGALVGERTRDEELLFGDVVVVLGVGDGRVEQLHHRLRRATLAEAQRLARVGDVLAHDEAQDLAHLGGGRAVVAQARHRLRGLGLGHQRRLDRSCPAWYRNVRVGANSPSL